MAILNPTMRIRTFDEVTLGYTSDQAMREAARCRGCSQAPCRRGCPIGVDIPGFISLLREGKFQEAAQSLRERNTLPGICGRVCPQERNCEKHCVLAKKGAPIAIGKLERFVADWEREHELIVPPIHKATGRRVAVVGSGPAGLTVAAALARQGHKVMVFEALHAPGGVLSYGIPQFRLPKEVVAAEIDYVCALGVEIELNAPIGKLYSLRELRREYDAVFLGTGAGLPRLLGIPGEHLNGVYTANEFLTRVNLMRAYLFPEYSTPVKVGKQVVVIGGGNVAVDAARVAVRLGAEEVVVLYRRTLLEMPVRAEEYKFACREGVLFRFLVAPLEFRGDAAGWVKEVFCIRCELGEVDETGRRRPVPVPGSEFTIPVDTVIVAIGQEQNTLALAEVPELLTPSGRFVGADPETGATPVPGVYAGGDLVTGAATVIEAISAGKRAAKAIDRYLAELD